MKKFKDSSAEISTRKSSKRLVKPNSKYLIGAVIVVLLAGAGAVGYKEIDSSKKESEKLRQENAKLANPQESAKLETERVKSSVAKLIDVPAGEDPTIASVIDASKLSAQAFFKKAQNGDKVVMYAQAKKAILYRPSTNKIIEVAPINIGNNDKPAAPAGTETPQ